MTSVIRGSEGDIPRINCGMTRKTHYILPVKVTGDQLNKPGRDRMPFQGKIAYDDTQAGGLMP